MDIQQLLNDASVTAKARNKTITASIPEDEYTILEGLVIPGNVSLIGGSGLPRSARITYRGSENASIINMQGGYGSCLRGFEILSIAQRDITAIQINDAINCQVSNIRVDLRGIDNIGCNISGRESVSLQNTELRASNPLQYAWGDNVCITNADLGCSGLVQKLIDTCVQIYSIPSQITFDGYQTWQKGKHAIYGVVSNSVRTGQGLNIYNLRYEQSTTIDDANTPAVFLSFNKNLENLLFSGCRWTVRKNAMKLTGVLNTTRVASFLPGLVN